MSARFFVDLPLTVGSSISLPDYAARHVQVLRLQPGGVITLFNSLEPDEGEFLATVDRMGRNDVDVTIGQWTATQREAPRSVHLIMGMPANDRMDWLVEKATELGVASIQPLITERSVLRLSGDRASKKLAHWRGVAAAACEQCGRNRVPVIHAVASLNDWLKQNPNSGDSQRLLLSLQAGTKPLVQQVTGSAALHFLSGPEGGLGPGEESAAIRGGFLPVTLGPRVLRAETAPLACLALLGLMS
jgi:16S rRNA (uracil1498-N3)-methyltransferase